MLRLSGEIEIFNSTPAGTTIGRKLNECGQIGVTIIAGTDGWIIEAPAATVGKIKLFKKKITIN